MLDSGYDEIENGWVVYSADHRRVGMVLELNVLKGYLRVQRGRIFTQDMYVPLDGIARAGHGAVHLAYDQGQIDARDWDIEPAGRVTVEEAGARDEPTIAMQTPGAPAGGGEDTIATLRLHEEELAARTRTVEPGRMQVDTGVVEEPETITVRVRHDEVRVERVPMDAAYEGQHAFRESVIEIPLMRDRLITGKRARVVEEVRIYKRTVVEDQQMRDTVRQEQVHIDEHQHDEA
jgi:uncharacterized protein (TIGR02271 family)